MKKKKVKKFKSKNKYYLLYYNLAHIINFNSKEFICKENFSIFFFII